MIDNPIHRAFELIGVNLNDGRSRVLRAIIASQNETGSGCTFEELRIALMEAIGGKDVTRPLIYRYLKSLEEERLIEVDRGSNPNLYVTDIEVLSKGIDSLIMRSIKTLETQHNKLSRTVSTLSSIDASWLARDFIELLVGAPFESGSRYTLGVHEIDELIGSEIYSRARKGDIIRVTLDWNFQNSDSEPQKRELGYNIFDKGVKMMFLLHNPERVDQELLSDRMEEYKKIRAHALWKDLVETRVSFKDTKTYQSISLNRDGIVLIVSEDPYTAVWVPRSVNSKLVDDVIDSYDEDFENGVDFLDLEV